MQIMCRMLNQFEAYWVDSKTGLFIDWCSLYLRETGDFADIPVSRYVVTLPLANLVAQGDCGCVEGGGRVTSGCWRGKGEGARRGGLLLVSMIIVFRFCIDPDLLPIQASWLSGGFLFTRVHFVLTRNSLSTSDGKS